MHQPKVSMAVRRPAPKASIVDVEGELTAFAEDALMQAYADASSDGARTIVLNFAGLEYMNSSGIGLLVKLLIRVNRQKQRLLIYGLSEHYRHIFELTRLDEAIGVYESEETALAAGAR